MDPLFLFWMLILALPVGYLLLQAWHHSESLQATETEQQFSALLARKEAILAALRELEMDYRGGKLSEEDYRNQREALLQEGATVLKELETLQQRMAASPPGGKKTVTLPAAIETSATASSAVSEDPIEALLQQRKAAHPVTYIGFCPSCGAPLRAAQRFCAFCGAEVPPVLRRKARRRVQRQSA